MVLYALNPGYAILKTKLLENMKTLYVGPLWPGFTMASWGLSPGEVGPGWLEKAGQEVNSTFHTFTVVYFPYSKG